MARPRIVSDEMVFVRVCDAIARQGPRFSLRDVATSLSVSEPALLKRFGSRKALVLAAVAEPLAARTLFDYLAEGPQPGALRPQIGGVLRRVALFFQEALPYLLSLREEGLLGTDLYPAKGTAPRRVVQAVAEWLERAEALGLARATPRESVAAALVGAAQVRALFDGLVREPITERPDDAVLDDVADLYTVALNANTA